MHAFIATAFAILALVAFGLAFSTAFFGTFLGVFFAGIAAGCIFASLGYAIAD